jgi:predicted nucleotidyltransferase
MVEAGVIKSVQEFLSVLEREGTPVRFGVIFGSQATGNANEWSDIDLLVVSPRFDENYSRENLHDLWYLAAKVDERIEPIPCGEIQWREDDSNLIIDVARKEGVVVRIGESVFMR